MFTNALGFATTNPATLTVSSAASAPTLTSQPLDQSVMAGSSVSFTASAQGTPTPTVQWEVSTDGGTNYTIIPGAASTTYTFTASAAQNGNLFRRLCQFAGIGHQPCRRLLSRYDPSRSN